MTVTDTDLISNIISSLRRDVYTIPLFRTVLYSQLKEQLYAIKIDYNSDTYGGWAISVQVNRNKCIDNNISHESHSYLSKVLKSVLSTIVIVNPVNPFIRLLSNDQSIALNILNVIITGPDSILIKI